MEKQLAELQPKKVREVRNARSEGFKTSVKGGATETLPMVPTSTLTQSAGVPPDNPLAKYVGKVPGTQIEVAPEDLANAMALMQKFKK